MSQITTKWITDGAITPAKLDSSGSFTMRDLHTTQDATVEGNLIVGGSLIGDFDFTGNVSIDGDATIGNNLYVSNDATIVNNLHVLQRLGVGTDATIAGEYDIHIQRTSPTVVGMKIRNENGPSEYTINVGGSYGGGTSGLKIRDELNSIDVIEIQGGLVEVGQFLAVDGTFSNSVVAGGTDGTSITATATTGTAIAATVTTGTAIQIGADSGGLALNVDGTSAFNQEVAIGTTPSGAALLDIQSDKDLAVRVVDNAIAATGFQSQTTDGTSVHGYTYNGTGVKGEATGPGTGVKASAPSGGLALDVDGTSTFNQEVAIGTTPSGAALLDIQSDKDLAVRVVDNAIAATGFQSQTTDGTSIHGYTYSGIGIRSEVTGPGIGVKVSVPSGGLALDVDGTCQFTNGDIGIGATPSGSYRVELEENDKPALNVRSNNSIAVRGVTRGLSGPGIGVKGEGEGSNPDATGVAGVSVNGPALYGESNPTGYSLFTRYGRVAINSDADTTLSSAGGIYLGSSGSIGLSCGGIISLNTGTDTSIGGSGNIFLYNSNDIILSNGGDLNMSGSGAANLTNAGGFSVDTLGVFSVAAYDGSSTFQLTGVGGNLRSQYDSGAYKIISTSSPLEIKTLANTDMTVWPQGNLRLWAPGGFISMEPASSVDVTSGGHSVSISGNDIEFHRNGISYLRNDAGINSEIYTIVDSTVAIRATRDGIKIMSNGIPAASMDIYGPGATSLRIQSSFTPSDSSDTTGSVGAIAWDDSWLYVKTSVGWKRATLAAF